jgi:hypothetical protein
MYRQSPVRKVMYLGVKGKQLFSNESRLPPYVLDFLGSRWPTLSVLVLTLRRFLLTE